MQGHQRDGIRVFFLVVAFEYVHQTHAGGQLGKAQGFAGVMTHFAKPVQPVLHVLPAALCGLGRGAVLLEPVRVVDVHQQVGYDLDRIALIGLFTYVIQPVNEVTQALAGAGIQDRLQADFASSCIQADVTLVGIAAKFFEGSSADLTARGIDHAQEGRVIIRIGQQA